MRKVEGVGEVVRVVRLAGIEGADRLRGLESFLRRGEGWFGERVVHRKEAVNTCTNFETMWRFAAAPLAYNTNIKQLCALPSNPSV